MGKEYLFDDDIWKARSSGLDPNAKKEITKILHDELGDHYEIRRYGRGLVVRCVICGATYDALRSKLIQRSYGGHIWKYELQLKRCSCDFERKISKEERYINEIISAFPNYKWNRQYKVKSPKGFYFIDLYCIQFSLAIECDEFGHKDRNKLYEIHRENHIKRALNCSFIRFNPDEKNFDINKVIDKINFHIFRRRYNG